MNILKKPILFIMLLGICLRLFYLINFNIESGSGDSSARALLAMDLFPSNYSLAPSAIWLPFYFVFFSIPLHFSLSVDSILIFQFVLSTFSLLVFYLMILKYWNPKVAIFSTFSMAILPLNLVLVPTALSEISFSLFVMLGCLFYQDGKIKNYNIVLSVIFFLCASMIRYEGWFFYLGFTFFDLYKKRNIKRFLIILFPFVFILSIYEISRFHYSNSYLHGLLSNSGESGRINFRNGINDFLERGSWILELLKSQVGLIFFVLPFALIRSFKLKEVNLIHFIVFISMGLVVFGTLFNHIALFERYWLSLLILGLPICIYYISSMKNKKISVLIYIFSLVLIKPFHVKKMFSPIMNGVEEANKFILSRPEIKKIYIDDHNYGYYFIAFKVYNYSNLKRIEVFHEDDNYYIFSKDEYKAKFEERFIETINHNEIHYLLLIRGSLLFKSIFNDNLNIKKADLSFIKKMDHFELYKIKNI